MENREKGERKLRPLSVLMLLLLAVMLSAGAALADESEQAGGTSRSNLQKSEKTESAIPTSVDVSGSLGLSQGLAGDASDCTSAEVEPNNTLASAQPLTITNNVRITGGIAPAGDLDYYRFQANAGERVWAYVATSSAITGTGTSTDTELSLLNFAGQEVQYDDDSGSQTAFSAAIAGAIITQTGTYYLKVEEYLGAAVVNPYLLFLDRTSVVNAAEAEPNDTVATANPYVIDSVVSGSISSASDADVFSFSFNSGETFVFQVDGNPARDANKFNPDFDLLNAAGAVLVTVNSEGGSARDTPSENAYFTITTGTGGPPTGTIYIRVRRDLEGPSTGTYNLHIWRPVQFADVPLGSTFYPFVRCLACRNILGGYADGTFRPNSEVTRGQISKIVSNAAGFAESPGGQIFEDVPAGSTFYDFVNRLARRGYMGGYPCSAAAGSPEPCVGPLNRPYFRPNVTATRGQLSKIVSEAAQLTGTPSGQNFEDVPINSTFYVYIERLVAMGAIGGYPCSTAVGSPEPCVSPANRPYFRPGANVTRGQASKIVSTTFFPGCENSTALAR